MHRAYVQDTLVLETFFESPTGSFKVIDFMPPRGTHPTIIRIVEGVTGNSQVEMELRIRFAYGKAIPWVRRSDYSLSFVAGPDALTLSTLAPLKGVGFSTMSAFTIEAGQKIPFILRYHSSTDPSPKALDAETSLAETIKFWRSWTSRFKEDFGEYTDQVKRSAITLKALTYEPTGGIVAAVTTSLPEAIGGERNWDYRFCWLRDATFTLYSLMLDGFDKEASCWRDWLLRAAAGDPSQLQIMYGLGGERLLTESELPWLRGYDDSRPVRIGNAASEQFQMDVYGELMDAFHLFHHSGLKASDHSWSLQEKLVQFVVDHWQDPDEGIWEVRGPRRHFTHSKAMAWVAVDRGINMAQTLCEDVPFEEWEQARDAIKEAVLSKGYSKKHKSFTQYFGSDALDASVLLLPLVGFIEADDPKMISTVEAIEKELGNDGLLLRYSGESEAVDGLPAGEGYFLACSFWHIDNLVLMGRVEEAKERFEKLISYGNDLGLLSEEYDLKNSRMLGNFPQAFSHVGLINSARNLTQSQAAPAKHRSSRGRTQHSS